MQLFSYIKLLVVSLVQDYIIFKPFPSNVEAMKQATEYNLPETSNITIKTEDGERLTLWVKQPENPDGFMFVVFHGNTGHFGDVGKPKPDESHNARYRIKLLQDIVAKGNGFVAVSHRGYGNSSGKPSEAGFEKDLKAVTKFLDKEKYDNLIIFGESLGANSALKLNEYLHYEHERAVVLIAPFTNLFDKTFELYPEFKDFDMKKFLHHNFDNKKIFEETNFKGKFLIFHPMGDETTPIAHSENLLEIAKRRKLDAELFRLSGCGHITWNPDQVIDVIAKEVK